MLDILSGRLYISCHVRFIEDNFPGPRPLSDQSPPPSGLWLTLLLPPPRLFSPVTGSGQSPGPSLPPAAPPMVSIPPAESPLAPSPESVNVSTEPVRLHHMVTRSQYYIFKPKRVFAATKHPISGPLEPSCASKALADPKWRAAMAEEYTALIGMALGV